ncbi:MAG: hypothetical protein OXC37_03125 [Bdellovibrionaceae bacterium]|nr:hypothetical protein [Pseudobdellovibrionaceae bacterium]
MESYIKKIFLFAYLFFLQACIHINEKIQNLPIRSSKSKILKTLGEPYGISRKSDKDYWTYRFIIEGKHYQRDVIIKDGLLYGKTKIRPFFLKEF